VLYCKDYCVLSVIAILFFSILTFSNFRDNLVVYKRLYRHQQTLHEISGYHSGKYIDDSRLDDVPYVL
jgi:hypothetical protein